jgi:hypothetical protein
VANFKFRVYLRRDGLLVELHNIARTPTGLYFNQTRYMFGNTVSRSPSSSTYHEDGKLWSKGLLGRDMAKHLNQPLSGFKGQFSLSTSINTVLNPRGGLTPNQANLRPGDIVFERLGTFGTEIILSESVIELPELPDRPNRTVYVKDQIFPVIIIEVFGRPSPAVPSPRFPRLKPLVEGETLFFDHPGRI